MYLGLCAYKQACVLYVHVLLIIVKTTCMPFSDCNTMVCIEKHIMGYSQKHKVYILYSF